MFDDNERQFQAIAPPLLAIFPAIIMFLITSIATLRERTNGTLERVLTTPIGKADFVIGYGLAFGLLASIQAIIIGIFSLTVLGLDIKSSDILLVVIALCDALLGMALGLLASAFARTEFQAVQFMPAVIVPQLLLCGLLVPLTNMPDILEKIARVLPMTYAVEAIQNIASETTTSTETWRDIIIVIACVVLAIIFGSLTLRRTSK
jgi:ABC-2 type transport system permease protein